MLELDGSLRALAAGTSRRGVLAQLGKGLVGAALLMNAFPLRAHAISCSCVGQTKCGGVNCGARAPSTNGCCTCTPPCLDCGSRGCDIVTCPGATCCVGGDAYVEGWYWYCCKPMPLSADNVAVPVPPNELWKCQDCCDSLGNCYTVRDVVGEC
jgi:hypothetical protein